MATVPSAKRMMIDKNNARIVVYVSVAVFILIFSLVATKTLIGQGAYQNKVIGVKRKAVAQLRTDISATTELKSAYDAFNTTPQNVLGGSPTGTGAQDGTNSKIVLDALPSGYDFPGLTTSLEAMLNSQHVAIGSIAGTDDQVAQGGNQTSESPTPVAIPFTTLTNGSYADAQKVISVYEHSIRPIQIQTLDLSGPSNQMAVSITAQTYYQPAKSLNIKKEVVK
ncbi:MAG TPA: hypothetical protein VLF59_03415 [Candidatus Saccharimonadales bacterium]|nr:hypothetical protein [Candidatus Saccharimonadales bacterium]